MSTEPKDQATLLTDWTALEPGRSVTLRAHSSLHKGDYECAVLDRTADRLRVSMPMENGKLVLVPVGTIVSVEGRTPAGIVSVRAQVVDRRSGRERSLLLGPEPKPPEYLQARSGPALCRTIAVTSGKGGVGKTALAVNLGVALAALGRRVCVVDADLGTANVDVLLNMTPRWNLSHVISGEKNIFDVLVQGPRGLVVLPGGSGLQELTALDDRRFGKLLAQFHQLERFVDVMLLDTGSGLAKSVTNFVHAADETILVTTPEPHAITDAYALIKVASQRPGPLRLRLMVNRAQDEGEARDIARKMSFASRKFLDTELDYLGWVVEDAAVGRAIRRQQDLLTAAPRSRAAGCVQAIAAALHRELSGEDGAAFADAEAEVRPSFLHRIRRLFAR